METCCCSPSSDRPPVQRSVKNLQGMNNNNNNHSQTINKKRRTCRSVDFAVPADHIEKWKKKKAKTRISRWTGLGNWKKTVEHESNGYTNCRWCIGTDTERLVNGQEDLEIRWRVETVQVTVLLRSARILRIVLGTWGDLSSLRLHWKTIG